MTTVEFFASIAFIITDVLAVFSVIGSGIVALTAVIEFFTQKQIQLPQQILIWGFGGVIFGFVGFFLLLMSDYIGKPVGVVFRLPFGTIGILLTISLVLLLVRVAIRTQVSETQARTASRKNR